MHRQPAVLILAFLRKNGVQRLIQTCLENDVSRIYISIDGPRSDSDKFTQQEILKIIQKYQESASVQFFMQLHERNLGVGVGVISGLDWFFSHEDSGHILEDDLIIESDFFTFSRKALLEFQNHESVKMISGSQLIPWGEPLKAALWTNYPMIWGWSSWSDRWEEMRAGLLQSKSYTFFRKDSVLNNFWAIGANRVLDGRVDTWDTPLAAEFYMRKWICIIPPSNLVTNFGDDLEASHTKGNTYGLKFPIEKLDLGIDFHSLSSTEYINKCNELLEKTIFRVRKRHFFAPFYSLFLNHKNRKLRKPKLRERLIKL